MDGDEKQVCCICGKEFENVNDIKHVYSKGIATLTSTSKKKGDGKWENWSEKSSITVHENCRKGYYFKRISSETPHKKRKLDDTMDEPIEHSSPISNVNCNFNFTDLCMICGLHLDKIHKKVCQYTGKLEKDRFIQYIKNSELEDSEIIINRFDYALSSSQPFSYHLKCYDFLRKRNISIEDSGESREPRDYSKVFQLIERSGRFKFNLKELLDQLSFSCLSRTLRRVLKEKYNNEIYFLAGPGKQTIVFYQTFNVADIFNDWIADPNSLGDLQKKTILSIAADILKSEIQNTEFDSKSYPPSSKFLDNVSSVIPFYLHTFLRDLLEPDLQKTEKQTKAKNVQVETIGHAIISSVRPHFISTLQLAVGTYIYRKTGSKLVIDLLSQIGLSSSYYELRLYEASTVMDPPKMNLDAGIRVDLTFDNTDHNVKTLDGLKTFHSLGGIGIYTPSFFVEYVGGSTKLSKMPSASEIASQSNLNIVPYGSYTSEALKTVEFEDPASLLIRNRSSVMTPVLTGYLWGKFLKVKNLPSWKGFMEVISRDTCYTTSHISCLPFINEPPSKLTTLNTALHMALAMKKKLNQKSIFVTFDQPLYHKARCIVAQNAELENVIPRLGGFHLLMSFLAAIGYTMKETGLDNMWSSVYAPDSTKKMMTGHAFARAMRAHILSFIAIGCVLCEKMEATEECKNHIREFFKNWNSDEMESSDNNFESIDERPTIGTFNSDNKILKLRDNFCVYLQSMEDLGPTSKLWIQYFKAVKIVLDFYEAERLGDWQLHLQSVRDMLPLFHATGHYAYAKDAHLYLQDMAKLDITMDHQEFAQFSTEGYFTTHRSDKPWSGVWNDMVIEQTLNRFFGTDLRHGRGVTPSVVTRYLKAMPAAVNVMECLENYAGLRSATSEQHVDLYDSRIKRDDEDLEKFIFWLAEHNPFTPSSAVKSLSTGILGGSHIDVHNAFEKGLKGVKLMETFNMDNVTLSSTNKVKTLANAYIETLTVQKDSVNIDSNTLFQRMIVIFNGQQDKLKLALSYELSPFPPSIFDPKGLMRDSSKSKLYTSFQTFVIASDSLLSSFQYVVDGGWLLRNVTWPHSSKYSLIFEKYLSKIKRQFGSNAVVVFDGYQNEIIGTKSYERFRRKEKVGGADVSIHADSLCPLSPEQLLSNVANKFKLVDLLSKYLTENNIRTYVAQEDADAMIVNTAIDLACATTNRNPICIAGNDVDLFVLSIALTPRSKNLYYYKIDTGKKGNQLYRTQDHHHLRSTILFAHAFSGCDTTSAFHMKGKKSILDLLRSDHLQKLSSIFLNTQRTEEELYKAAETIVLHWYGPKNKSFESLKDLRYYLFSTSISSAKKRFDLSLLPPTESALLQHVKRVYHQIQQWLGNSLNAEEWGWRRSNFMLVPVLNEMPLAPDELFNQVSCGCKTDCKTSRCSCKKAGINCTLACKHCNGESCHNSKKKVQNLQNNGELDEDCDETPQVDFEFDEIQADEEERAQEDISVEDDE